MLLTISQTRIRNILERGTEVELELLGLQEAVELLGAVACLDADQIPPQCIEIAALCGRQVTTKKSLVTSHNDSHCCLCLSCACRLPLCLNIVGNLIRTYGGPGWEEEIPRYTALNAS